MFSQTLSFALLTLTVYSSGFVYARPTAFSNALSKRQGITWDELKNALEIDASCIPDCAPLMARLAICTAESLGGDTSCFCDTDIQTDAEDCLGCIVNGVSGLGDGDANNLAPSQEALQFEQEWNSFCGTDLVITAITPSEASTAAVVAPTVGAPAPVVVVTTTSVSPTLDLFTDASTTTPYDSSDIGGAHGDYPLETTSATSATPATLATLDTTSPSPVTSVASVTFTNTTTTESSLTTSSSSSPSKLIWTQTVSIPSSSSTATGTINPANAKVTTTGGASRSVGGVAMCTGLVLVVSWLVI